MHYLLLPVLATGGCPPLSFAAAYPYSRLLPTSNCCLPAVAWPYSNTFLTLKGYV